MIKRRKSKRVELGDQVVGALERERDYWFNNEGWPKQGTVDGELFFALGLGAEFPLWVEDVEDCFRKQVEAGMVRVRGIDYTKDVAKVWLDEERGVLRARFPYRKEVIEELRNKIPKGKKSWNAELKVWEFSVETIDVLIDIFSRWFDEVVDLTKEAEDDGKGDGLLSILDRDDLQAIYRLLAKKYHPDRGGDGNKMAQINKLFGKCLR